MDMYYFAMVSAAMSHRSPLTNNYEDKQYTQ